MHSLEAAVNKIAECEIKQTEALEGQKAFQKTTLDDHRQAQGEHGMMMTKLLLNGKGVNGPKGSGG
jgi:hypothetical protein